LKPVIRNLAIIALKANPNMSFRDRQQLMISFDESLMQSRTSNTNASSRPRVTPSNRTTNSPITSTTPSHTVPVTLVKAEAARQYTRPTNEERENLKRIGACFRCRQPGHLASDCPRNVQVANLATIDPLSSAPTNPAATTEF
jgi:hypothetical protein